MYDYDPVNSDIVITNCIPWICNGTNLINGSHLTGMLGYEVDGVHPSSPANIQVIAASPYSTGAGTQNSNMTYYRQEASGAGVFATGSMNWNLGLAQSTLPVNLAVQQITRNVLNSFVTVPPQARVASSASVKALHNSDVAPSPSVGGCAFSAAKSDRLDIGLLLLLAANLIWRWSRHTKKRSGAS
jgi:hypothetical protein